MFYFWHALAIVLLSVSSFGIGYTVASEKVISIFKTKKEI
jgi:hypothetical protein